jgi:hypothetical protein
MANLYQLTPEPVLIRMGWHGRAVVRASVPFMADDQLHCADHTHYIYLGHQMGTFRALGKNAEGVIRVQRLCD